MLQSCPHSFLQRNHLHATLWRLLGQNTSCLHIQALLEKGNQLFKIQPTHKGNIFISTKHTERIFVASKGSFRKTIHATVTKRKDFLSCKVNSSRIHTSQHEKLISFPWAITGIRKNSEQSSHSSRSKAVLISPLVPVPLSTITRCEKSFENSTSNWSQSSSERKHRVPGDTGKAIPSQRSLFQLPSLPCQLLPPAPTLFYYLNLISSHLNFLNNTGYLKPQAWSNAQKLSGFKKRGVRG